MLFFLLSNATDLTRKTTLNQISKIIIFINSIQKIYEVVTELQIMLLRVSNNSFAEAYFNQITDIYCVNEIIQIYTFQIFKKDQSIQFAEFMKSDSHIHIMIIIISLEMKVNISDVKCTVI